MPIVGHPSHREHLQSRSLGAHCVSLPMSYEDVIPILTALNGKGVKATDFGTEWSGGLESKGVEYWIGPSDVELEMVNRVNDVCGTFNSLSIC